MTPAPIEAPLRLAVGETVTGDPSRPRPHRYEVHVPAGHYLRVVARQLGVDVVLRLVPPAGGPVLEIDSPTDDRGDETAHVVAEADGVWTIEVEAEEWPEGGGYELRVADRRPATGEDRLWAEVSSALARAEGLRRDEEPGQREAYAAALAAAERVDDPQQLAYVLFRLGDAVRDAGEMAEARSLYERSLAISRRLGDEEAQGKMLNRIASVERRAGHLDAALEHQRQAVELFRRVGDDDLLAGALAYYGQTLDWAGRPREALAPLHEALDLRQRLGDRTEEAVPRLYLGDVHLSLDQLDLADDHFEQAAALARESKNRKIEALALRGLAACATRAGDAAAALPHLWRALELARQREHEPTQIVVLGDLGSAELVRGDTRAARAALEESLALARRRGDVRNQAFGLHKLGRCHHRDGDHRESARLHAEAAALFAEIGDRISLAGALYGQARALGRLGEIQPALDVLAGGLSAADEVRRATGGHELQTSYAASKQHYRELHVDLLMALHEDRPEGGFDLAALSADDQGRARALVDLLDQAVADGARVAPRAVAERDDLERRLAVLHRYGERLIENGDDEALPEVERQQRELLARLDRVRAESRPAAAMAPDPRPWTAGRLDALLDRETLLLVYSLGEERSFLWAVWQGGRRREVLPPRADIESPARRMAEALARLGSGAREEGERAGAELAGHVLASVADRLLRHRRVVVVADGALLHVPFAALPDPGSPGVPLVATHELATVPSLSVLERLRRRRATPPKWRGLAAVVADPVFEAGDPRVAGGTGSAADGSPTAGPGGVLVTRALDDLGIGRFARLPGTRAEAEALLAELPEDAEVYRAFDFAASREAVLAGALSGYRIVHLATHGVLDRRTPSLSGLVFSLVDEDGRPRDGYLPLHEIYGLRLDAEVIVLSACQSGTGREMNGEGLVGLTRGFLDAGVPRLVVSLWQVGDQGSAELMRRFYRSWLRGGDAPAAALATAQRSMWEDEQWSAPYHWAGFQLVGDWTAPAALQSVDPDDPIEKREDGTEVEGEQDDDLPGPTLDEPPVR